MCKENLGEARYNDQISNLAARYVNDNPDDAEFKNCPSLKKRFHSCLNHSKIAFNYLRTLKH